MTAAVAAATTVEWTWAEEDVVKVCHLLPVLEQTTISLAPPRACGGCVRAHGHAQAVSPRKMTPQVQLVLLLPPVVSSSTSSL